MPSESAAKARESWWRRFRAYWVIQWAQRRATRHIDGYYEDE